MRGAPRLLLFGLLWISCEGSDCGSALDQIFGEEPASCGSGPERNVEPCVPTPGRAEVLEPVAPDVGQPFVHVAGVETPSFAMTSVIPARVNGISIDEFMAGHPHGYLRAQFADLDRDGDLDVVRADDSGSLTWLRVYRNRGDGTFDTWQGYRSGRHAVVCDVDVDGDLDVVSLGTPAGGDPQGLFINDGTGMLAEDAPLRVPRVLDIEDVACFDADGNGAPEIAVATSRGLDVVLFNHGNGVFAEGPRLLPVTGTRSRFVLAGDVDGDGWADLVFGGEADASRVVRNRGGGFTDPAERLPVSGLTGGALGDVDGDGDLDLVAAGPEPWMLLVNDGAGHFTRPVSFRVPAESPTGAASAWSHVSLGDVDGDGDLDWGTESPGNVLLGTLVHPLAEDREPPLVELVEPVDGTSAHVMPNIDVRFDDAATGVRPGSVRAVLNGTDISSLLTVGRSRALAPAAGGGPWRYGDNLLEVEVRDLAGNGIRRSASLRVDAAARPFAAHLSARDGDGTERSTFARGMPIRFVLRIDNGGGASLYADAGCGSPMVEVFDHWGPRWGSLVWRADPACIERIEGGGTPILPCSSLELPVDWNQDLWISGDAVEPGVYVVRACLAGGSPGLEAPPEMRITIE